MTYLLFGGRDREVKAEFDGLSGKTVAVIVYTDLRTQYDYPDLNLTLSSAISGRRLQYSYEGYWSYLVSNV